MQQSITRNRSQQVVGEITPLTESDTFFGFEVLKVLGHAPDHIALYQEEKGILFAGDLVIEHSSSNALIELGQDGKRTKSLIQYEASLKKIANLDIKIIYAGHGSSIQNSYEIIDQKLARIERRSERVLRQLNAPRSAAELAKILYKDRYETLFPLIMSEVIGHLDRLENLQLVEKESKGGIYYYSWRS